MSAPLTLQRCQGLFVLRAVSPAVATCVRRPLQTTDATHAGSRCATRLAGGLFGPVAQPEWEGYQDRPAMWWIIVTI
jgi:hypothetical protein